MHIFLASGLLVKQARRRYRGLAVAIILTNISHLSVALPLPMILK